MQSQTIKYQNGIKFNLKSPYFSIERKVRVWFFLQLLFEVFEYYKVFNLGIIAGAEGSIVMPLLQRYSSTGGRE